ncbi:hypothetical protein K1719_012280 [Acacia pycnantha]|nr:hypothetical protein K1719_012280 [Acacia pycnantha]
MAPTEEPILTRIDRLDNMLKQLEEIRGYNRSPKSSFESTPSSGTLTNDGHVSSVDISPKSLEKHCRPIDHVIMETEVKGTLIERLDHLEDRMLKIEIEAEWHERRKKEEMTRITETKKQEDSPKKKKNGLKQFVKHIGLLGITFGALKTAYSHKSRKNSTHIKTPITNSNKHNVKPNAKHRDTTF